MEKIPFTPQGLETIKEELAHLKGHERQAVINAIAEAREHGDLSENAEYHPRARSSPSSRAASTSLGYDKPRRGDRRGEAVRREGDSAPSASPTRTRTRNPSSTSSAPTRRTSIAGLSDLLPLAKGLIGKSVGDSAEVHTPGGVKSYEIISIELFDMSRV